MSIKSFTPNFTTDVLKQVMASGIDTREAIETSGAAGVFRIAIVDKATGAAGLVRLPFGATKQLLDRGSDRRGAPTEFVAGDDDFAVRRWCRIVLFQPRFQRAIVDIRRAALRDDAQDFLSRELQEQDPFRRLLLQFGERGVRFALRGHAGTQERVDRGLCAWVKK